MYVFLDPFNKSITTYHGEFAEMDDQVIGDQATDGNCPQETEAKICTRLCHGSYAPCSHIVTNDEDPRQK
jgi:hypothetical protein